MQPKTTQPRNSYPLRTTTFQTYERTNFHKQEGSNQSEYSMKGRLWKQVGSNQSTQRTGQNKMDSKTELFLQARNISQNSHYEEQEEQKCQKDCQLMLPNKNKQKCTTISNFLKQLQIQSKQSRQNSRFGTDSQIVSIMDIKYTEQFTQNGRKISQIIPITRPVMSEGVLNQQNYSNKSQILDKKFQASMLFSVIKETKEQIKAEILQIMTFLHQQTEDISNTFNEMSKKYEAELSKKNFQIRSLELKNREHRVQSMESNYHLEAKLTQYEEKCTNLQQAHNSMKQNLAETLQKLKQSGETAKQQKQYNKELNELILKFHSRMQELEQKMKSMENDFEQTLIQQNMKTSQKYENLLKQTSQKYELKLQSNRIMIMNLRMSNNEKRLYYSPNQNFTPKQEIMETSGNNFEIRNGGQTQRKMATTLSAKNGIKITKQLFPNRNNNEDKPLTNENKNKEVKPVTDFMKGTLQNQSKIKISESIPPQALIKKISEPILVNNREQTIRQGSHAENHLNLSPKSTSNRRFQRTKKDSSPINLNTNNFVNSNDLSVSNRTVKNVYYCGKQKKDVKYINQFSSMESICIFDGEKEKESIKKEIVQQNSQNDVLSPQKQGGQKTKGQHKIEQKQIFKPKPASSFLPTFTTQDIFDRNSKASSFGNIFQGQKINSPKVTVNNRVENKSSMKITSNNTPSQIQKQTIKLSDEQSGNRNRVQADRKLRQTII